MNVSFAARAPSEPTVTLNKYPIAGRETHATAQESRLLGFVLGNLAAGQAAARLKFRQDPKTQKRRTCFPTEVICKFAI
jgi:hypothetical protein